MNNATEPIPPATERALHIVQYVTNHRHLPEPLVTDQEALLLLLQDLSLEPAAFFGRYGLDQNAFAGACSRYLDGEHATDQADSAVAVLLLYIDCIEISARYGRGDASPSPDELSELSRLVDIRRANLGELLQRLYLLGENEMSVHGISLDWNTLKLHRLGTTSIIFRISGLRNSGIEEFVLKLSHVLFTSVGPIAKSTSCYMDDWGQVSHACPWVVPIYGSGIGWVLEQYCSGETLREYIMRVRTTWTSNSQRLKSMLDTFLPICIALDRFYAMSMHGHGDLNPSNIILQAVSRAPADAIIEVEGQSFVARFIDIGRNLLSSSTIGRVQSVDSRYVDPAVNEQPMHERKTSKSVDLFSLGQLLMFCMGYDSGRGFYRLDEAAFIDQPQFSRIAAHLVDTDPSGRDSFLREIASNRAQAEPPLIALANRVSSLGELLSKIDTESIGPRQSALLENLSLVSAATFGNLENALKSFRLFRQAMRRGSALSDYDRWTSGRIALSTVTYAVAIVLIVYTGLLDAHMSTFPPLTSLLEGLGYNPQTAFANWQVRIVSLTFLVAGFQYNTRVFGGISFVGTCVSKPVRFTSELTLWIMTSIVLILMCIALFQTPLGWPVLTGCGLVVVATSNLAAYIARRQIRTKMMSAMASFPWLKNSAVEDSARFDVLAYWAPTLTLYTLSVFGVAIALLSHNARDFMVYAIEFGFINLVIFSYSQAYRQGPLLRGNLTQYIVVGENLVLRAP